MFLNVQAERAEKIKSNVINAVWLITGWREHLNCICYGLLHSCVLLPPSATHCRIDHKNREEMIKQLGDPEQRSWQKVVE